MSSEKTSQASGFTQENLATGGGHKFGELTAQTIIIGGGSAGSVLAMRLSLNPESNVLLLEAGPNFAPDAYPPVLTNAAVVGTPEFDWGYASDDDVKLGHKVPTPRGKVLGGSSTMNGTVAMRARPSDFQRWAANGLEGWGWDDVLPAFKALENTPTGADYLHGRVGPFPIRQRTFDELTPSCKAFIKSTRDLGLDAVDDFNGDAVDGVGPYSLNVIDNIRMNTGMTYLSAEVRKRPNLTIRAESPVDRLVFENGTVSGVVLVSGEVIPANNVILSAGAFGSPAILMRSGIGPAEHLRELDIPVIADLPVGKRLQDHPLYYNVYALKKEMNAVTPAAGALVWTGSKSAPKGELDLQISATHFFDPANSPTGGAIVLASAITLPHSMGSVQLASTDPQVSPRIEYNYFDDARDLDRMVEVVQLAGKIARSEPFVSTIASEIFPGLQVPDGDLRDHLVANVSTYAHPTSTVPMGRDGDPDACVDRWGKVRGVNGLRVVDASIFPTVPSVPTNPTTIMVAERIAAWLLK